MRMVAGMNSVRVISLRLTRRGLGVSSFGSGSGWVYSTGTLRPNRTPVLPIRGYCRSLKVPSGVRW